MQRFFLSLSNYLNFEQFDIFELCVGYLTLLSSGSIGFDLSKGPPTHLCYLPNILYQYLKT